MKPKLLILLALLLIATGLRADVALVSNGRFNCPLNASTTFVIAAWNTAVTPTLLAAGMGGLPAGTLPCPMQITVDPTTQTGAGAAKYQYYAITGTNWRDVAQTETLNWNNNEAATPKTTTAYFKTLTQIAYTEAGGSAAAGLTDVGYAVPTYFTIPLRTTQFSLHVDTAVTQVYMDMTATAPGALTAAWSWPSQTVATGWIYHAGQNFYFAPKAAAAAGDCLRWQCWRN